MPEFLTLLPPSEALKQLLDHLEFTPKTEEVKSSQALNRVTAKGVLAPHTLPSFDRSTVDGYAVHASDTYGASESLPAYLSLQGEVPMGSVPQFSLDPGKCALIHTGGMMPPGSDAVVMLENTQRVTPKEIELLRSVAIGENVLRIGEDVGLDEEIIPSGKRLRPAEIGGLMALGITKVSVIKPPIVGILSTGDEILPPEEDLKPGMVRDINSYTLSALVQECGGVGLRYGIIQDRSDLLRKQAQKALDECDLVVITAGSSASVRDLTSEVINQLAPPGVLVHGVNVRPGKPTILAVCDGKAVIGLPGNPVSALVIAELFVAPVIEYLLGLHTSPLKTLIQARLTTNLPSQAGREDWVPVRLIQVADGYQADPIFGKSNLIFTLVRADGLIRIPPDATGISAGETVEVKIV
jgi:molybdopterin molybdotransferase